MEQGRITNNLWIFIAESESVNCYSHQVTVFRETEVLPENNIFWEDVTFRDGLYSVKADIVFEFDSQKYKGKITMECLIVFPASLPL